MEANDHRPQCDWKKHYDQFVAKKENVISKTMNSFVPIPNEENAGDGDSDDASEARSGETISLSARFEEHPV